MAAPFPKEVAAVLLLELQELMGAIEAQSLDAKPEAQAIPAGLLTCGELCRVVPALVSMLHFVYPDLWDEDAFAEALRDAPLLNNRSIN